MSCQQVPTAPAFNPYPRSVQVGEFEVAIGGGIWVAIGALEAKKAANWRSACRRSPAGGLNPKGETFEKGETLE